VWSYINKTDLESFINAYPNLAEGFDEISLHESEEKIFVPRLFYMNFPKFIQVFERELVIPAPTFYKFTGTLRENQIESITTILDIYQSNKYVNGIMKCPPGFGR
jgi:hypothetical protein